MAGFKCFNSLSSSRFLSFLKFRGQLAGERRSSPVVSKKRGWGGGGLWGEKESPAVDPKDFTELCSPTNGSNSTI